MKGLEERIAALSPEKRRLLELRLAQQGVKKGPRPKPPAQRPIPRRPEGEPAPLTYGQQRLWFIDRLHPGTPAYNVPFAGRLEGELDAGVVADALGEMGRRHEILRTRFVEAEGRPVQVVEPRPSLRLTVVDLTALPPPMREREVQRLIATQPRRLFDLARGPLVRLTLVRLGERLHELLVTMAHIVTDAWSMAIFFRELPALYEAFRRGEPSPLPELSIQVADFAAWQRRELDGEDLAEELDFWLGELAGAPPVLELPTDRPRPPVQTFRGHRCPVRIPVPLTRRLSALAEEEGATLFMALLAGFGLMLARWSGQEDLLVASPVAVRTRPETFPLIGFFIDNAVLRVELGGQPGFRGLLRRVRDRTLAALSHQDLPFDKLVEALGVERDLSRMPLVQVNFVLQNVHIPPPPFEGITLTRTQQVDIRCSRFDLTLGLYEEDEHGAPRGALEHNTDLFDVTTATRMVEHLGNLLAEAVRHPERPVTQLAMLGEGERRQVLAEWNDTARGWGGGPWPEILAGRAREAPEAAALAWGAGPAVEREISYHRLLALAGALARRLRREGVGAETAVGVLLERSPEAVVGALAVLLAGGVWVPLDPSWPAARLAFLLEDSGARWVVARQEHARPLLARLPRPPRVLEPEAAEPGAEVSGDALRDTELPRLDPRQGAYLIYTSGSTGVPKGVLVTHGGLANLARAQQELFGLAPGDRVLQFAPLSFDASVWETVLALTAGAALHLAPRGALLPGPDLAALLAGRRITHATLPPTALAVLPPPELPDLGWLVSAGEACPAETAAAWGAGRRFVNAYGPTEVTVCASAEEVSAQRAAAGERPPIGRPLGNVRLHVVDRHLQPLPAGVPGELLVAGAGLARGYHRRPDATAAAFVPDPFGGEPGGRLYRTGDRVRWLPDGRLEFLGRLDAQLKVRGHRVEPGEVEAELAAHAAVSEAVVDLVDGRLTAWVTAAGKEAPGAEELRRHLRRRLPEAWVPGIFVPVEALPLTPSGKVDRAALPRPGRRGRQLERSFAAPAGAAEETLARVWSEVLGVERVGADDNFFDLGGDSILGIRMISRAAEEGVRLEPIQLFEHPTVRALAATAGRAEAPAAPAAETSAAEGGAWPLTPLQQGLLFHSLAAPGSGVYVEQATATLEGDLDTAALAAAWQRVVDHHPALRASFHRRGEGEPVQRIQARVEVPWRREDWRRLPEEEQEERFAALLAEDARRGFAVGEAPLLRLALARVGERRHRLLWSYHHLLLDGWSVFLVLSDVFTAYRALATGSAAAVPELPARRPFTDYLGWLAERDRGEEETFWRRTLAGFTRPTPLPGEAQPGKGGTAQGKKGSDGSWAADRELDTSLPTAVTAALQDLARYCRLTLGTLVHGAWALLLAGASGEEDVVFGTVVSGRPPHLPGSSEMVGLFINTLPVRVRIEPERPLFGWLADLQRWQLEAQRHEHSPLAAVQRWSEVAPGRALFQTLLAFENYPRNASLWEVDEELAVRDLATVERTNYPLNLAVVPGDHLGLRLSWDHRRLSPALAERLLVHLVELLTAMAAAAQAPGIGPSLAEVGLLTEAGRRELVGEPADEPAEAEPETGADTAAIAPAEPQPSDSELESELRELWGEVLGVPEVAADGNFFELGGDSILSLQLTALLSDRGIALTPRDVFEHPTPRALAPRARAARAAVPAAGARRETAAEAGPWPLTPLQQGLLFHSLAAPGSGVYVEQTKVILEGDLDAAALAAAWQRVADHHPALRASFHRRGKSDPVQRIHPRVEIPWRREDWRRLPAAEQEERFAALLAEDARRGFAVGEAPVMRLALARLGERRHGFLWSYHHLLLDGWSVPLVLADVFTAYRALAAGSTGAALELPARRPFTDYLGWLAERDRSEEESFWRRTLAGFTRPTPLPGERLPGETLSGDRERPPAAGDERSWTTNRELESLLPAAEAAGLQAVSRRCRLTLSTLVHGAWALLLAGAGGEEDVVFGTVVSGRPPHLSGSSEMVGLFINTLPVRVRIEPERPLFDWLADLQRWQIEAQRHEHSPLAAVQRWSELPPGTALFETLLAFENYPRDASLWEAGEALKILDLTTVERTNYPLNLAVAPGERLGLRLSWDQRRLSPALAKRLLAHLEELLAAMAAAAEALGSGPSLAEVGLLTEAGRRELLGELAEVERAATEEATAPAGPGPRSSDAELEAELRELWAEVLGVPEVAADGNFFELGGDSILSLQLTARLSDRGIALTPRDVFEHPTPRTLAPLARRARARRGEQGPVTGPVEPTPIQRWFFEQGFASPNHWNMSVLLELPEDADSGGFADRERLEAALGHLMTHHDALRLRFEGDREALHSWIADPGGAVGLAVVEGAEAEGEALEAALAALQGSLDLTAGPLVAGALIRPPQGPPRLLLTVHHLAVDAVSWGILLADLERAVGQLAAGREVVLPAKTTSYQAWAEALREAAGSEELRRELVYWTSRAPERAAALPLDSPGGSEVESEAEQVEMSLAPERTASLLGPAQEAYGTRVEEMLLAALAQAFAGWTGSPRLWLQLEGHGRLGLAADAGPSPLEASLDLSRTVGWFTAQYPVLLDLEEAAEPGPGGGLRAVKEQLRRVPHKGVGYGVLRHLGGEAGRAALAAQPPPQVSFNYLGRMDQMLAGGGRLRVLRGPTGPQRAPEARRPYRLEINALVLDGRLRIFWGFSPGLHHRATVESLAGCHLEALEELLDHCLTPGAGAYTPSDFPAAGLDQEGLDRFLDRLAGEGEDKP